MDDDVDYLNNELSKISITNQQSIGSEDAMSAADALVPCSIKLGYVFRCSLSLEKLIEQNSVQSYLLGLLFIIEEKNKIYDFQMRLRNQDLGGFTVVFIYKDMNHYSGPIEFDTCIFCDTKNKLSQLSLIKQNSTTCIWLDVQLRNKFIVTPREHIARFSEMSEEAMSQFWHDTQVFLDDEGCDWRSMVLNHGKYRDHAHFHMKINIDQYHWNERITKKYEDKIRQIQYLFEHNENNIIEKHLADQEFNE